MPAVTDELVPYVLECKESQLLPSVEGYRAWTPEDSGLKQIHLDWCQVT